MKSVIDIFFFRVASWADRVKGYIDAVPLADAIDPALPPPELPQPPNAKAQEENKENKGKIHPFSFK